MQIVSDERVAPDRHHGHGLLALQDVSELRRGTPRHRSVNISSSCTMCEYCDPGFGSRPAATHLPLGAMYLASEERTLRRVSHTVHNGSPEGSRGDRCACGLKELCERPLDLPHWQGDRARLNAPLVLWGGEARRRHGATCELGKRSGGTRRRASEQTNRHSRRFVVFLERAVSTQAFSAPRASPASSIGSIPIQ